MKFSISSLIQFYAVAALIYITLGDAFLPHPYNVNSQAVRNNINEYMIGLFPQQKSPIFPKNRRSLNDFKQAKPGSEHSPF